MAFTELLIVWLLCILSFTIGARIGQKVANKEEIRIMKNPVTMIQEIKETKEQAKERERNRIIAENIDNYDGSSLGQKDIPK